MNAVDQTAAAGRAGIARPIVAIVGRPNVGKSALFNRLIGRRKALVEEIPGTTRDRLYGDATWGDTHIRLVDTGGLELGEGEGYSQVIRQQVEQAVKEASVLLFIVDAKAGVIVADEEIAEILRPSAKPVFLVVNKVDNETRREDTAQFYKLGLGEPMPVSAQHGTGVADLLDSLVANLPVSADEPSIEVPRLAIVGRPNVGKSMLTNAILGQERVIVSAIPGTTRDAIDTPFEFAGRPLVLIDTAGLRRPGKVGRGLEHHASLRAQHALERADVAFVLFDAVDGLTAQDIHIIGFALEAKTGVVVVANKWDMMDETAVEDFERRVRRRLRFAPWLSFRAVSAKDGTGVPGLIEEALALCSTREQRIDTPRLNAVVRRAVAERTPPAVHNQQPKFLYVTQPEVRPPTFVFFVNDAALVHFSYRRYLENVLRDQFGFRGVALRLTFRSRREH